MDRTRSRIALTLVLDALERHPNAPHVILDRDDLDDEVRREVESLLAAHADSTGFLRLSPTSELAGTIDREPDATPLTTLRGDRLDGRAVPPFDDTVGATDSISGFRLIRELGRGGMGVVYLAEQPSLGRRVALKVLAGPTAASEVTRFSLESEALARLSHPGVATILETGTEGAGPRRIGWLAMELVEGATPITAYAVDTGLDFRRRLELFCAVCDAVDHGHQKGVIHRDLKPSNIVVDSAGTPKVIDFGIARLFRDDMRAAGSNETAATSGTPAFMSPERFDGGAAAVDVRIDVYALGAVLYELVCGAPAFDVSALPLHEAIAIVRTRDPIRPRVLNPRLARDIETIILAALARDPGRRYPSVAALASDIRRFLGDRPIEARPTTALHRINLFWRRHRPTTVAVIVGGAAIAAAVVVSIGAAIDARRAETEATRRRDEAEQRSYVAAITAAESALASREFARLRASLANAPEALRGWEWTHLAERSETATLVVRADERRVYAIAMAPDGSELWSAGADGTLRSWDSVTGVARETRLRHQSPVLGVEISPDGSLLVSAASNGTVAIEPRLPTNGRADADDGTAPLQLLLLGAGPTSGVDFAFTDDGRLVACGGGDGRVRIWSTVDGSLVREIVRPGPVYAIVFVDSHSLVIAGERQGVDQVDITSGATFRLFSPDQDGAPDHEEVRDSFDPSERPTVRITDLAWLADRSADDGENADGDGATPTGGADGRRVLLMSLRDHTARFVALELATDAAGHLHPVRERFRDLDTRWAWALAVAPDGRRFASGGVDMHVRLWSDDARELRVYGGHAENVSTLAFTPDGATLWTGGWDGTLRRWDVRESDPRLDEIPVLHGHSATIQAIAFAPQGDIVASAGRDGRVCLWDHRERRLLRAWRADDAVVWSLAFTPDCATLVTGLDNGTVVLWDVATGARLATIDAHDRRVYGVAVSADGRRIASASRDRTARVWSRDAHAVWQLETTVVHDALVWCVAFSPSGDVLATASWDRTVRLTSLQRDPARGVAPASTLAVLVGHTDSIYGLAFSPDGSTIASGGRDRHVILWDVEKRSEVRRFEDHGQFITALAFLPDGSRLVGATWWGRTMLWDPRTGATLLALRGRDDDSARTVGVSADGRVIACAGGSGRVWLWEITALGD